MDEQSVQLRKQPPELIAATKEHDWRVDYEHQRNGTATVLMYAKPLSGFRLATQPCTADRMRLGV